MRALIYNIYDIHTKELLISTGSYETMNIYRDMGYPIETTFKVISEKDIKPADALN